MLEDVPFYQAGDKIALDLMKEFYRVRKTVHVVEKVGVDLPTGGES